MDAIATSMTPAVFAIVRYGIDSILLENEIMWAPMRDTDRYPPAAYSCRVRAERVAARWRALGAVVVPYA